MLVHVLQCASQYNNQLAVVIRFDANSDRFMLKVGSRKEGIRVKRSNIRYPATCPQCYGEVTSSCCFDCGYGHESKGAAASGDDDDETNLDCTSDMDSDIYTLCKIDESKNAEHEHAPIK